MVSRHFTKNHLIKFLKELLKKNFKLVILIALIVSSVKKLKQNFQTSE